MNQHTDSPVVILQGRIDGLTAPAIRRRLEEASTGTVRLLVDLREVTYLSSAGLRVFMQMQKELRKAGGGIVMWHPPACVTDVLKISGMESFFSIETPGVETADQQPGIASESEIITVEGRGYQISLEQFSASPGVLEYFGKPESLATVSFRKEEVVSLPLGRFTWGTGIAASGSDFEDYRQLFGESVILSGHFFSYPAVRRPSVDYSLLHEGAGEMINFLYGFGFTGSFSALAVFSMEGASSSVGGLLSLLSGHLRLSRYGVVLAGRSGGLFGMHLRRSPALGLSEGDTIFDPAVFPSWFAFPAEPDDFNATVVATGIFSRRDPLHPAENGLHLPAGSETHLHAMITDRGLINFDHRGLTVETERILREFEPRKVVHLLPSSRIIKGILGIIPLP